MKNPPQIAAVPSAQRLFSWSLDDRARFGGDFSAMMRGSGGSTPRCLVILLVVVPMACSAKGAPDRPRDSGVVEGDADADADADGDTDSDSDVVLDTGLPDTGPWRQVAVGLSHACAIRRDQSMHCWGDNYEGQSDIPVEPYLQVAADWFSTCAIRSDSSVGCWGDMGIPYTLPGGTFRSMDGFGGSYCAIRDDGAIECWGHLEIFPAIVEENFIAVSVGHYRMCAIGGEGSPAVQCWGVDAELPEGGPYVDVCVSEYIVCLLDEARRLVCFDNDEIYPWGPWTDAAELGPFVDMSCNGFTLCLIDARGKLHAFPPEYSSIPEADPGTYSRVECGDAGSCAIGTDGLLTCWGESWLEDDQP